MILEAWNRYSVMSGEYWSTKCMFAIYCYTFCLD